MLVLGIILILLILLLITPVGVDLRYDGALRVRLKFGILHFTLFPGKENKTPKEKKKPEKEKKQPGPKPTLQEILELVRIALQALGRFRRRLSIDLLRLYVLVAADDPYDAVLRYGALNAGLGVLAPLAHNALKIRSEDVRTNVDVQGTKSSAECHVIATLQIWEILWIAICFACAFLSWNGKRKKKLKAVETIQEEKAS